MDIGGEGGKFVKAKIIVCKLIISRCNNKKIHDSF